MASPCGVPGLEQRADVRAGSGSASVGLANGGRVTVIDLGDAVVLLPPGARQRLLADELSAEENRQYVENLDDPDLATT